MTAVIGGYSYHPEQVHNSRNVATVWVTQLSYYTLSYVTREFWPHIRRKILGHRHQAAGP